MTKSLIIALFLSLFFGCGKTKDQEVEDIVLSANIHLNTSDCQGAIDILEDYGRVNDSAAYLKTLSAAYACRAGYSSVTFFTSDIALTATPAPLGGSTKYSTSGVAVTAPLTTDPKFDDLRTAMNLLLYAGGIASTTEPSAAERARWFGADDAANINSQLLFMELVQLGKFMRYYGAGSAAGVKGHCLTNYNNAPNAVKVALIALPGACTGDQATTNTDTYHAELNSSLVSVATRRARLCEGIVLLNGIFDILPSVMASASGGSLSDIATLTASITAAKNALTAADPSIGYTLTVLSQANCEADSAITTATLESYYALMFEGIYQ